MKRGLILGILFCIALLAVYGATTIVSPLNGGTGLSNPAAHSIMLGEGSSAFSALGAGGIGTCLEGNGASSDPSWQTCPTAGGTSGGGFAWAGSGTDGAITADGTAAPACLGTPASNVYTMVRDCLATTFTVNSGVTIKSIGWRFFGTTSITVNGTIQNIGGNGGNGGAGNANGTAGTAGAVATEDQGTFGNQATGCLWASSTSSCTGGGGVFNAGVAGGAGNTGAGTAGTLGSTSSGANFDICPSASINGVAGGAGGNGTNAGGGAGTGRGALACTANTVAYSVEVLPNALTWSFPTPVTQNLIGYLTTNGGGGSGGGGGGDGTNKGGGGGGSGANGGYGNLVVLSSPTITVGATGVISADGGNGGTGGNGGSPSAGNTGGGGGGAGGTGGNGGVIVLVYHSYSSSGAVHATHGTGGTKGTHGTHSGTGVDGSDGNNGSNGLDGLILQIPQ